MIEVIKHTLGICGEHWHPNVITLLAGSPLILSTVSYIKSCCGGWFKHKKDLALSQSKSTNEVNLDHLM
jgi:hypothetical protein